MIDSSLRNAPRALIVAAVATILFAACAETPVKPSGAAEARNKLTRLQSDPNLGSLAPAAVQEADAAVRLAEEPQTDRDLGIYRVYIADRDVEIARAQAQTQYAESQRAAIQAQRQAARLAARTRELDVSRAQTSLAQDQTAAARDAAASAQAGEADQKMAADQARSDALAANLLAAGSAQQAADLAAQSAELQRQISSLQARVTERGLVLTLGDVLFTTGQADLKPGAASHLDRLVAFLNKYPTRTVEIDGFTDSVGGVDYNQSLSQRRADAVQSYLRQQGIASSRLTASGKGQSNPVADNASASGRQQNRRVEVVISNETLASS